jgi:putative tricarboxylic transport membrane protein
MDTISIQFFQGLVRGLVHTLEPWTMLLMMIGLVGGIILGAIPGMTGSMGIILLLPLLYHLKLGPALVTLAAMFCGAMYGGSISAILIRTPGHPSAAATVLDGYPMAQKGEAGMALSIAVIASVAGGLLSGVCLIFLSPELAKLALQFRAPEFFTLAVFGLTIIAGATAKNILKGLIVGVVGVFLSRIGVDEIWGTTRYTFGTDFLMSGLSLLPALVGLFAFSQVFYDLAKAIKGEVVPKQNIGKILPTKAYWKRIAVPILVGSVIGITIGIIPGTGGAIACFLSYDLIKRFHRNKDEWGTGVPEGIAAPESANNGTTGGAMIPMLSLGVPGDSVTAVMLGALMLVGVRPGPMLFVEHIESVYTLFSAFMLMQIIILILGLGGIKVWPKILDIPQNILTPLIVIACFLGSYTLANSLNDALTALIFGIIGYFMQKYGYPAPPLILGLILGPMTEANLNRALIVSEGSWMFLFDSPISTAFVAFSLLSLIVPIWANLKSHFGFGAKPKHAS